MFQQNKGYNSTKEQRKRGNVEMWT